MTSEPAYQNNTSDGVTTEGQKEEFESFFRLFYTDLCKFVYSYTQDRDISKDIVQSVFLKVWEQKDFWNDLESAKSYLYKSVRNEALNYKKHQKVKRDKHSELRIRVKEWKETYEQERSKSRKVEIIQKGIEELPDRCKEIFKLSRESGLTYKEIAKVLGLSVKTVETQMGRAFRSLRSFVQDNWSQLLLLIAFLISC